ncbi:acyl-[ACP]--phospholipid O-acyltransferase [Aurantimonas sp. MSK8Z-1]|uniref:acyl-[ACP]--phospholipid O-acyltransferase n=1 Tax=Mangrovibrevibacter kandeliae TaxID=2968473 RepID=UPI00211832CE|nr:acyl-[ACP]--phospholipid O-acyltransferase [Aurantimonas sp. MSK8Z-1]MCW4116311.1 acyl-[ACP]--phospholipid O-acyltransferase [Aurantimonas sp. MSK8Z-1]
MSSSMLFSKRFGPLFATQFLSAFVDNFLKNALVFVLLFGLGADRAQSLVTLAGAIFIAPFVFLSGLGGELADKYDKALVARRLKLAEIGAAGVAAAGFILGSIPILFVALFLFGTVSALFGPLKYGILPDHLEATELPKANAFIEGATFAAILAGTIAGGLAAYLPVTVFAPLMLAISLGCWLCSRAIPATRPAAPDLAIDANVLRSSWHLLRELTADRRILVTALAVSWFWCVGLIALSLLPALVTAVLAGPEWGVTFFLTVFAVAVAAGSAAASWLSAGRTLLLPAVIGSALVALACGALALVARAGTPVGDTGIAGFLLHPTVLATDATLALLAFGGGLLVVPTFAAIQVWAPGAHRARVIAGVNVLSALVMAGAGILVAAAQAAGASIGAVFAVVAVLGLAATVAMARHLPFSGMRDAATILFRVFHRLEIVGAENIGKAGPNPILALNHVSYLDAALALCLSDRDPVFAIDHTIAQAWWVKPFLRLTRAMPLDPTKPLAVRSLVKAVEAGDPLVIFPEGRITVTGSLMKVYDGAGLVADKTGAPILPVRIEGLERSYASRLDGRTVRRSLFPKVRVTIEAPQALRLDPELKGRRRRAAAGAELYRIMSDLVFTTTPIDGTVFDHVVRAARLHGHGALAVQDPVSGDLSYGKLLAGARVLAERFYCDFAGEATLGIMLPNANGAVATLLGVLSAGKVPAMVNFSAGASAIRSSMAAAQVKTVLTSRAFVAKGKLEPLVEALAADVRFVWLEDLRQAVTTLDKLRGLLRRDRPVLARGNDDVAAILFTSGSEGLPKGVVLTHRNVLANVAQAAARIDFGPHDKLLNVLPLFHAFGLTAGLLLPLTSGVPTVLYPSPLHYKIVPEMIYRYNATILFGTDTFLAGYASSANPYDFRSLRYVFAGAEPVKEATRRVYMEKFGLRLLEGYGTTETAPVLALNTPMYARPGSVGKLFPGIEARLEPVAGIPEGGRLLVRGPNVMAGYLKASAPGVLERPAEGWHDTGDIVSLDADGFVTILGRAKRFAKIGGEMVSLAVVESLAAELWPDAPSAAAALPDPKKGERIVLLTELEGATRAAFAAFARSRNAPDLAVPAEVVIGKVPLLGSGKTDFPAAKRALEERLGQVSAAA